MKKILSSLLFVCLLFGSTSAFAMDPGEPFVVKPTFDPGEPFVIMPSFDPGEPFVIKPSFDPGEPF